MIESAGQILYTTDWSYYNFAKGAEDKRRSILRSDSERLSVWEKGGKSVGAANLLASSGQDVDFFIHGVFSYELFGQTFWITTTHVAIAIVMLLIVIFAIAARITISHAKKYPTGFQNIVEMIVEMLDKMVESSMGPYAKKFRNYIGSIFIFIFLSNISGLFGLRPPTADYGVTLPLGLLTFGIIQYNNIKYNKFGAFTGLFKPLPFLFPINLIGEIASARFHYRCVCSATYCQARL